MRLARMVRSRIFVWLLAGCFPMLAYGQAPPQGETNPSSSLEFLRDGLGCLYAQDWVQEDLLRINLPPRGIVHLRYRTGTIPGTSPETPNVVSVIIYAPDGKHAWMLFFHLADLEGVAVIRNAYYLSETGHNWSASEGNGGIATYKSVGRLATAMSKDPDMVFWLSPSTKGCAH